MVDETLDLLQIKIEKARNEMPQESLDAIGSVDWHKVILDMKERKSYTFEQLGDLEIETELLLCGLINPLSYPSELETRMKISKEQAQMLVNEMNELVFKKVRAELVKNIERKNLSSPAIIRTKILKDESAILKDTGITIDTNQGANESKETMEITPKEERGIEGEAEMLKDIENPSLIKKASATPTTPPILAQKLGGVFQMPSKETKYDLQRTIRKETEVVVKKTGPSSDPYRVSPNE